MLNKTNVEYRYNIFYMVCDKCAEIFIYDNCWKFARKSLVKELATKHNWCLVNNKCICSKCM